MKIIAIATATIISHISHYTVETKQVYKQVKEVKEHVINPKNDKGFYKV